MAMLTGVRNASGSFLMNSSLPTCTPIGKKTKWCKRAWAAVLFWINSRALRTGVYCRYPHGSCRALTTICLWQHLARYHEFGFPDDRPGCPANRWRALERVTDMMSRGFAVLSGAVVLLSLIATAPASGQVLALAQSTVQVNNAQFQLDLSSVRHFDNATISIQNTGSQPVLMPEVDMMGSSPATTSQAILAWLQAQGSSSGQALAEAGWQYVLAHMFHVCWAVSPYENAYEATIPWRLLRGYGFGCCDQAASLLAWVWCVEGFQSRVVYLLPGHTVAEVYYEGSWHMYDADHRVFYTTPDGTVASVAMIVADPSLIATGAGANGLDPVGYTTQFMENLYATATIEYATPNFSSSTYAAPTYALAPGQLLLLYSENIIADLIHGYEGGYGFGPQAVTSATLIQTVDFSNPQWSSQVYSVTGMAVSETSSGAALSTTGASGDIILQQNWPNPAFDLQLDGAFSLGSSNSALKVYFSPDGVKWSLPFFIIIPAGGFQNASLNLTSVARGAYSGYIKIQATGSASISSLKITSNLQFSKAFFPALIPGAVNNLIYTDGSPDAQPRNLSIRVEVWGDGPAPLGMSLPLVQNMTVPPESSVANLEATLRAPLVFYPWLAYGPSTVSPTLWQEQQSGGILQAVAPAPGYMTLGATMSWSANDTGLTTWSLAKREPVSLNFDWLLSPATTEWSGKMILPLLGTGDQSVFSTTAGGTIQLLGRPVYEGATASSLVPESPVYSIARGYGAAALVNGKLRTLAYPGGVNFDYGVDLGNLAHVSAVWLNWGYFGSSPVYIQNWTLYGRTTTTGSWQTLAQGGFPGAETSTVNLDTYALQLRIAASSQNWIGMYELEAAASIPLQVTAASNLEEQTSINDFGPASNLVDGNDNTLANPGGPHNDYTLDPGKNAYIDQVSIVWGSFGTNSLCINSWRLYGQKQIGTTWDIIAQGGFPNAAQSVVPVHDQYRRLRVAADGTNWIGIYEVQVYGNLLAQ